MEQRRFIYVFRKNTESLCHQNGKTASKQWRNLVLFKYQKNLQAKEAQGAINIAQRFCVEIEKCHEGGIAEKMLIIRNIVFPDYSNHCLLKHLIRILSGDEFY